METQTLVALVQDRPGVLNRITTLLRRRHLRLHTLSLGRSEMAGRCRLTVTVLGDEAYARRVGENLSKLVEVLDVILLSDRPSVRRDLALIKVEPERAALSEIQALCQIFGGRVVDVSPASVIVEIVGEEVAVERFRGLLDPFGVTEMVRSECVALSCGPPAQAPHTTRSLTEATR